MIVNLKTIWDEIEVIDPTVIGSPLTISEDGSLGNFEQLAPEQQTAVEQALAAHDPHKSDLIVYTADTRWRTESGTMSYEGMDISLDRLSQERIANLHAGLAISVITEPISYKALNGFFELSQVSIDAIYERMQAHIQACFAKEHEVLVQIEAGTVTQRAEIDAAFQQLAQIGGVRTLKA